MTKPPRGQGRPPVITATLIARMAKMIRESKHYPSNYQLAKWLGVSHTTVQLAIAAWTPAIEQRSNRPGLPDSSME